MVGGESGIRTHERLRVAGFQDRFLQPLGHLSISGLPSALQNTCSILAHFPPACQSISAKSFRIFFVLLPSQNLWKFTFAFSFPIHYNTHQTCCQGGVIPVPLTARLFFCAETPGVSPAIQLHPADQRVASSGVNPAAWASRAFFRPQAYSPARISVQFLRPAASFRLRTPDSRRKLWKTVLKQTHFWYSSPWAG